MLKTIKASVERQWYGRPTWLFLLLPLTFLFIALARWRRKKYTQQSQKPPVPVIVVGNITVGGTGKTPVIITVVKFLQQRGYKPGVIARGFGADVNGVRDVTAVCSPKQVGDEPLLIRKSAGCPVAVGANRVDAANFLYRKHQCNIILSDDGLQHYKLARSFEFMVIDGQRGFGNGWRLPVGPLREPVKRIREVDAVLVNSTACDFTGRLMSEAQRFVLKPVGWLNVKNDRFLPLNELLLSNAVAVAGIGNPERFFGTLNTLGFSGSTMAFRDHHPFTKNDFTAFGEQTVLMTAKDAIKCKSFAQENWWALQVEADLPSESLECWLSAWVPANNE